MHAMSLKDLPADARPREKLLARGAGGAGRCRAAGAAAAHRPAGHGRAAAGAAAARRASAAWPACCTPGRRPASASRAWGRPSAPSWRRCSSWRAARWRSSLTQRPVFDSPAAVKDYLQLQLGAPRRTRCSRCCSSTRSTACSRSKRLFRGTLTQTSVYPREVVKRALRAARGGGDPGAQPPVAARPSRRAPTSS